MKGKALGKGLSALIPGAETKDSEDRLLELELAQIKENPYQPREKMDTDSLRELADSIVENGIIQPLAVCKRNNGYQLIAGARRLKAAKLAGLRKVPAIMIEIESDEQLLELAIVENLQREDLNPIELAQGYKRLIDECGLTQEEVAKKVGKSRPSVANSMRLLKLPNDIQDAAAQLGADPTEDTVKRDEIEPADIVRQSGKVGTMYMEVVKVTRVRLDRDVIGVNRHEVNCCELTVGVCCGQSQNSASKAAAKLEIRELPLSLWRSDSVE